jgi:hypothetical protein
VPTLVHKPPVARPESYSADSGALELEVQSVEGQKVRKAARKAARQARPLSQGRAELALSEEPTAFAARTLRSALERYRRPDGYEGHLVEAAWQLEQMGQGAWPVLRDLILAGAQECEYFLGAVVRLEGVAPKDCSLTLLAAARNPDANVRSRLLELLKEMPGDLRREVLRELAAESRPDDNVTDRAREAWHEHAS